MNTEPVLDPEIAAELMMLERESPGILESLAAEFLTCRDRLVAELRDAAGRGDATAIHRAAHELKGASGNLGARVVAERCREIESLGAVGDLEQVPRALERLSASSGEALAAVRDLCRAR